MLRALLGSEIVEVLGPPLERRAAGGVERDEVGRQALPLLVELGAGRDPPERHHYGEGRRVRSDARGSEPHREPVHGGVAQHAAMLRTLRGG